MIKTFEQFSSHEDIDPYGEEQWDQPEFTLGEHTIVALEDYTLTFYKSDWALDDYKVFKWKPEAVTKINLKKGEELDVEIMDIDPDEQSLCVTYDDKNENGYSSYKGAALVPFRVIKIKK